MEPAIETSALTKYYGDVRGVEGLDLVVGQGEVFGFLGPNGAGKTTTIRLLLDLLRPTSGEARLLGLDVRRHGVEVRRRLGYLPGDLALYDRLTAGQVATYFGRLRGGVDGAAVEALAGRLGLALDRPVGQLSRGNRQKVGLLQAFVHRPELLILDEPTSGLDPLVQEEFHRMVGEARERGATVFLSSHVLSEVEEVADRAAIIRDGRLVAVEDIADLRSKAVQEIEVVFAHPVPASEFEGIPGVIDVVVDGPALRCRLEGRADPLVKALARHEVESLAGRRLDLEDIFLRYYAPDPPEGGGAGPEEGDRAAERGNPAAEGEGRDGAA